MPDSASMTGRLAAQPNDPRPGLLDQVTSSTVGNLTELGGRRAGTGRKREFIRVTSGG
jgi:hypothetical protein